jgi:O-methyltransferase domain/Dimerisation domain
MSSTEIAHEPQPWQVILQMLNGEWIAQAIAVAAALGMADLLADGPQDVEQLASAASVHADSLYRLLRALASVGVFAETDDGRFRLTPLAQCLRSDDQNSVRNVARLRALQLVRRPWSELLRSVKTGESGIKLALGMTNPFEYLSEHPEEAKIFDGAMTEFSRTYAPAIAEAYDFGRFRKIVDAGGGHAMLLTSILQRYPGPRGVVFDLPHVVKGAEATIAAAGLGDRCETMAGDLFESVPAGADAYLMRSIIHGFSKERASLILKNIRRAIAPEGRLVLAEFVVPAGNEPALGKLADLQMLVMAGGRERTRREFEDLFRAAGFRLGGIYPTASPQSVVEGIPA